MIKNDEIPQYTVLTFVKIVPQQPITSNRVRTFLLTVLTKKIALSEDNRAACSLIGGQEVVAYIANKTGQAKVLVVIVPGTLFNQKSLHLEKVR